MRDRAGQGRSAHAGAPLVQALAHLPWLSPAAASLTTLARPLTADTWAAVRSDPGAVLLIVRARMARETDRSLPFVLPHALDDPAILDGALHHLEGTGAGFADWGAPSVQPVYQASLTIARLAHFLAQRTGRGDPESAWVCGLLAPLGWLAVGAINPASVPECLGDPAFRHDPAGAQRRLWGLDHAAIGRRLARRWSLPGWLAAVVGHLGLPVEAALTFGADPDLFHLTALAVALAREQGTCLGLPVGESLQEAAAALGGPPRKNENGEANRTIPGLPPLSSPGPFPPSSEAKAWEDPRRVPLLGDLLRSALENRRQRDVVLHERLEREVDALHQKLEEQVRGEAERLQACKLAALAEFAAGAGHEINNPLAVISGQAQYLLGHLEKEDGGKIKDETSPDPPIPSFLLHPPAFRKSLQTIITQARRIHDLLREVMQFARPPLPRKALVDLVALVAEVAASLTDLAARRGVRLEAPAYGAAGPIPIYADEEQVRVALACLLRNAIEAASEGGWARVFFLKTVGEEGIDVAVEDSGPGPAPEQREHLFDPFYSGRSAGRGRGLGLPTAWRLTRLQGGDVRLAPRQNGEPTRFVLTLPRHSGEANPDKNPPLVQSVSQSGDSASPLILPAPSAEAIGLADSA